jgi:hypothetical protein
LCLSHFCTTGQEAEIDNSNTRPTTTTSHTSKHSHSHKDARHPTQQRPVTLSGQHRTANSDGDNVINKSVSTLDGFVVSCGYVAAVDDVDDGNSDDTEAGGTPPEEAVVATTSLSI